MLEILLTVMAWRKGWRWRALIIPMICWTLMFLFAGSLGEDATGPIVIVAICEFVGLIVMNAIQPASETYKVRESQTFKREVTEQNDPDSVQEQYHHVEN